MTSADWLALGIGYHLTCVRPAPASALGTRISSSLITHSEGCATPGLQLFRCSELVERCSRLQSVGPALGLPQWATATSRAMAQTKAAISRAMATTTWLTFLPRATNRR